MKNCIEGMFSTCPINTPLSSVLYYEMVCSGGRSIAIIFSYAPILAGYIAAYWLVMRFTL